jgi:hypothetical protein
LVVVIYNTDCSFVPAIIAAAFLLLPLFFFSLSVRFMRSPLQRCHSISYLIPAAL